MEEKTENPLEIENLKQIISLDFQNLKDIVNGMAKSLVAFSQAKIDISLYFHFAETFKIFG